MKAWLARHPRFHVHFTPTSSSWLNLVERFFADLTGDVIRAGSFTSVKELVADIKAYRPTQRRSTPYTWKAEGAAILERSSAPAAFEPRRAGTDVRVLATRASRRRGSLVRARAEGAGSGTGSRPRLAAGFRQ
ncbi:MAG: transposase [Rhodospirillales bacterium]|nr:transposase [Rhodospirillales bacterium]